jgi:hypothetical protein
MNVRAFHEKFPGRRVEETNIEWYYAQLATSGAFRVFLGFKKRGNIMRSGILFSIVAVSLVVPSIAHSQDSIDTLIEYARQPIVITEQVERTETVYRQMQERIRCVEWYGPRGRRCRIVYRTITKQVAEQRTTTSSVARSLATVAASSTSKNANQIITLDAPLSAGAIAERVIARLELAFPSSDFPVTPDQDREFPVNINSNGPAKDGLLYQFIINPQSDPRFVDVLVVSDDPNGGDSTASATARLAEAEKALTDK